VPAAACSLEFVEKVELGPVLECAQAGEEEGGGHVVEVDAKGLASCRHVIEDGALGEAHEEVWDDVGSGAVGSGCPKKKKKNRRTFLLWLHFLHYWSTSHSAASPSPSLLCWTLHHTVPGWHAEHVRGPPLIRFGASSPL